MGNSSSGRSWPRDVRDLFRSNSRASRRHGDRSNGHRATDVDVRPESATDAGRAVGSTTQRGGGGGGNGRTNYNKLNSCPDLQVVARSGCADPQRRHRHDDVDQPPIKLNVKIYRSYRFDRAVLSSTKYTASKNTIATSILKLLLLLHTASTFLRLST